MQSERLLFKLPPDVSSAVPYRASADALRALEQRLAEAQRELSLQSTRIEQIQAELGQSVQALRRARDGATHFEASRRPFGRVQGSRNVRRYDSW